MSATFDQLDDALAHVVRSVRRASVACIEPHGIAMHQLRALRMIGKLGTPRIADLAEHMDIAPRSVTEVVDHLVGKGLANRSPNPADRRSVVIELTKRGRAVLDDVVDTRREVVRGFYGVLDGGERDELLRLLRKIVPGCSTS